MENIKEYEAYEHGKDAAQNGANTTNSNFRIFSSPEMRDAWQKGYTEVLKSNPSKRAL